jgi:hypothetical protein
LGKLTAYRNPSANSVGTSNDRSWTDPEDVYGTAAEFTTIVDLVKLTESDRQLYSGYGFSIPADSQVVAVNLSTKLSTDKFDNLNKSYWYFRTKDDTNGYSPTVHSEIGKTLQTYTITNGLWGNSSISAADVNSSNFGADFYVTPINSHPTSEHTERLYTLQLQIEYNERIIISHAQWAVSGQSVSMPVSRIVSVLPYSMLIARSHRVSLLASKVVQVDPSNYAATGQITGMTFTAPASFELNVVPAIYTAAGQEAEISQSVYILNANNADLAIASQEAYLSRAFNLVVNSAAYAIATQSVSIIRTFDIGILPALISVAGQAIQMAFQSATVDAPTSRTLNVLAEDRVLDVLRQTRVLNVTDT